MANQTATGARAKQQFEAPGHYTDKDREKIPDEDFAGPNKTFPILTQQDVHDAAKLIGHADDPAAVKAKIIKIAKARGFALPKEWADEEDGGDKERSGAAETTRGTDGMGDALTRITLPAEVRIVDVAKREFEVCATSEAIDSFGTIFSYEATKDAFSRWKRNIREMHAPLAVGRGIEVRFEDPTKRTYVRGRVSRGAESTWLKLEDGVLQGASIGASNVRWEHRVIDGKSVPVATAYDLVELSLVDNPSNPDAYGVQLVRSAAPAADVWQTDAEAADEERARGSKKPATSKASGGGRGGDDDTIAKLPEGKDAKDADASGDLDDDLDHDNGEDEAEQDNEDEERNNAAIVHPGNASAAGSAPADADVLGTEPDGEDAEHLDTSLRPVALEGTPSVAVGKGGTDQLHAQGGPPAHVTDQALAASRPAGVIGSEVAPRVATGSSRSLADRVGDLAQRATASDPQLAPFGYGATASAQTHQLPNLRRQRDAQRAERDRLAAEVRRAGEIAAAGVPPWNPESGEQYPAYVVRVQTVRGAAEQAMLLRQRAERDAQQNSDESAATSAPAAPVVTRSQWQAPRSAAATQAAERIVAAAQAAALNQTAEEERAMVPAAAAVVAAPEPASELVAVPGGDPSPVSVIAEERAGVERADGNAAIVQVPGTVAPTGTQDVELGAGRRGHTHTHAHASSFERHHHAHEHEHLDGTIHTHEHAHAHDHHDHGATERAAMAASANATGSDHSHQHSHLHDHSHTYRAGQPFDSALALPEVTRTEASGATLADADAESARAAASSQSSRKTMNLERPTPGAANLGTLHPVSGSAQSALTEQPKSPQMSVQQSTVGHLDLLNTEDANAVGFGVPPEVQPIPTPADLEVTAPAGFHAGGHQAGNLDHPTPLSPSNNSVAQEAAHANAHQGDLLAAGAKEPGQGAGQMDDDLDYDADEDERERQQAGGRSDDPQGTSLVSADDIRIGARVSAESRIALHEARGTAETAIRQLCGHCGCEDCAAYTTALDAAAKIAAEPDNPERALIAFGQQRVLEDLVTRAVAAVAQTLLPQLAALAETTVATHARLADVELTLADAQRSSAAEFGRIHAIAGSSEEADTPTATRLTETITQSITQSITQATEVRLASIATEMRQHLEAFAADAAGTKADVEQIRESVARMAEQPAIVYGPQQYATEKRLAINSMDGARMLNGGPTGNGNGSNMPSLDPSSDPATQIAVLQELARTSRDPQFQAKAAALVMQLQPHARRLLGDGPAPRTPRRQ